MRILGISAFYHDSAAALVEDGRIVAAAQEERFTRKKHDPSFPIHAIDYCLEAAGAKLSDVVRAGVFLVDIGDFAKMNEVFAARFGAHRPARSTVGVAALPAGARVEIDLVVRVG